MKTSPIPAQGAPNDQTPSDLTVVSLNERPAPLMSLEGFGILQCLDGYLQTLVSERTHTTGAARLDARALKRSHAFLEPDMNGRKVALRPAKSTSSAVIAQLGGKQALPSMAPPSFHPAALAIRSGSPVLISPIKQRVIDSALMDVANNFDLIKPIFWPHFEIIVDARFLRQQFPEHRDKEIKDIAYALGGMVDYDLLNFIEVWRQRKYISAETFWERIKPCLTCPISQDFFEKPVLTFEGHNVSLEELAQYYAPGRRRLYGGAPALGTSFYGYPNRRMAEICRAMLTPDNEYSAPDVSEGLDLWEVGILYDKFREEIIASDLINEQRSDLLESIHERAPREDNAEFQDDLQELKKINSVTSMLLDEVHRTARGELLLRAYKANDILFKQLVALVDEMRNNRTLSDMRVRIATDAALLNSPIHATQEHFMSVHASLFITALRQSRDLGSIVRGIFLEQNFLRTRRSEVQPLLREIDVSWLRTHDPMALTYLQMAWYPILYRLPEFNVRWNQANKRDKLDSLTYALWVGNRDLRFSTLFEPFEDLTDLAPSLALHPWETENMTATWPYQSQLMEGMSRSPSLSSGISSSRQQLDDLPSGAQLYDSLHSSEYQLGLQRSARSLPSTRSLPSIRQVT